MDITTWLNEDKPGRSKLALARSAGVTWKLIHSLSQGHVPRVETARKIEQATEGAVTAAELLGVAS